MPIPDRRGSERVGRRPARRRAAESPGGTGPGWYAGGPQIMNDQNGNSKCQAPTKSVRWTWIGLGVLLLALFIAVRALPVAQWLTEFNRWIAHLGIWGILLFIVGYILATALFFLASVLTIGAGFVFGVFLGTV